LLQGSLLADDARAQSAAGNVVPVEEPFAAGILDLKAAGVFDSLVLDDPNRSPFI